MDRGPGGDGDHVRQVRQSTCRCRCAQKLGSLLATGTCAYENREGKRKHGKKGAGELPD